MKRESRWVLLGLLIAAGAAYADGPRVLRATLSGDHEVPPVSTDASGELRLIIFPDRSTIQWELSYSGLRADATQAHIHFGQPAVNGGISVFFCSNLPNPPAGTQACPARAASLSGAFTVQSVIGPAAQGIAAGDLDALVEAVRSRLTYANVHSTLFPTGEIRGQIGTGQDDHRH
jgi:hypothetical protein